MRLFWWLALVLPAAVHGQAVPSPEAMRSAAVRCGQVTQIVLAIKAAHGTVPPDLETAGEACKTTPGVNPRQQMAKMAEAGATLDRLKLTPARLFDSMEQTASGLTGMPRFYVLVPLAKSAFNLGKTEKARQYAREALQMASEYPDDWNYGNAIYYGYFVLGLAAVEDNNLPLAEQYLMNSASTPGSPQLNSFGPNMALAKVLLERGHFAKVGEFLAQCKNFWKMDRGNLDAWMVRVQRSEIPDFGANLEY